MLVALRVRDFRLLWGAGLVSSLGSWLLVLAVPAHVFLVTRSLAASGWTLAAEYLPVLVLGPVAGVFADRWDRRWLMIGADVFRAGAVALMLAGASPGLYWVLYLALVAESSGSSVFAPALRARTPEIVGTGSVLSSANALSAVTGGVVRLLGGPLGGVLLAVFGFRVLVCGDVASYLVSAMMLAMTARPAPRAAGGAGLRVVGRELAGGMRALRGQPVARALFVVTVVFLAANAALSAVVVPFGVAHLGGARPTGLLFAALGVGFLLGGPVVRVVVDRCQPGHVLAVTLAGTAVAFFLLFSSSSLAGALPAAAAVGLFGSMSLVVPETAVQRVVPHAVLGRVSAVFLAGEAAVTLIGSVAGPALAQAVGLAGIAEISSAAALAAALLAYLLVPSWPGALRVRLPRPAIRPAPAMRAVRLLSHFTAADLARVAAGRGVSGPGGGPGSAGDQTRPGGPPRRRGR